jgi:hypothetical protein
MNFKFLDRLQKNTQIEDFMKMFSMGAELFHADRQTDGHDETSSRFSQFRELAYRLLLNEQL